MPGPKRGGKTINDLRYTDKTELMAENEEGLRNLLDVSRNESSKKGLDLK